MKISCALLILAVLGGCNGGTNASKKELKVYENSTLMEAYPYLSTGDNLVLHYYFIAEDEENIADDEFAQDFFFEFISEDGEFYINSDAFAIYDLSFIYREYCFCVPFNRTTLIDFDLSGTRSNNGNWEVTGTVTILMEYLDEQAEEVFDSSERTLNLSGTYRLSTP